MNAQLHEALSLIESRARSDQDRALLRELELARESSRRRRRASRRGR